jgi:putative flavoprotein involved in K+ transport
MACRQRDAAELGIRKQPYCLIVGAGHCGLSLGARLKQLNVPTLLIDRQERPSDTGGRPHAPSAVPRGFVPQLFRRGFGYYVDIGASGLIANGSIKVRSRVSVEAITPHALALSDGSGLPADVIVYATGYQHADGSAWQVMSDEVAAKVGKIYGYGSGITGDPGPWEGEMRNLWKPTQQKSLWFHAGGFIVSRFYSRVLALQIKAHHVGIPTAVYAPAEVHHRY